MKTFINIILISITTLFFIGCGSAKLTPEQQGYIKKRETLYTQVSMWSYKNQVKGTNYSTGMFIPVNSKVTIVAVSSSKIKFTYNGKNILIINTKYTKVDIKTLLDRTFSKSKVNLSKFSKKEQSNILKGKLALNMSKEATIIARGYPPTHTTSSLKKDSWKYWASRWDTIIYKFKNNKISSIIK
ncbi:hypothetical protein [Sulfurimonas sp.]|uniref:hypothetical protein n=1 Tax=Sulfurimonas sp. TaxID=2022749 RepID=UPI002AB05115|nr:hypothetical protein [Sulfurimonas sp.]